jgi:hypothetical protein
MRETGLDPGGLPSLPEAPSLAVQMSLQGMVRSIEFQRGYRVTSPRFLKGRRVYRLTWTGLDTDDADALLVALEAATHSAVAWVAPGDLEAHAWAILPPQIAREGSDALSCTVVELVFVAEAIP